MKSGPAGDRVLGRRLRLFAVAWCVALGVNNSLPYLGMRDDSCQTMFSGLDWGARTNNHAFVPQHPLSDVWREYRVRDVEVDPIPPEHSREGNLTAWLSREGYRLNDEAIRVVVDQVCDAGYRVSFERVSSDGRSLARFDDACGDAALAPRWWIPVRLYAPEVVDDPAWEPLP